MVRRLVEAHHARNQGGPSPAQIEFWLRECRTPDLLIDIARMHPEAARRVASQRAAVQAALGGDPGVVRQALREEEARERSRDDASWEPLIRELETLRRERARRPPD